MIWVAIGVWFVIAAVIVGHLAVRAEDADVFLIGALFAMAWPVVLGVVLVFLPVVLGALVGGWIRRQARGG